MDPALETLLKTQPALWRGSDQHHSQQTIKTGFTTLDNALPGGGWQPGTLTELLVQQVGIGEFSLLLPTLKSITNPTFDSDCPDFDPGSDLRSCEQGQWSALVNPPFIPYAPALTNAGIRLNRILIVDTDNDKDTLWSTEQLLRAGIFTVVVCWIGKTSIRQQRRLQLAAEAGNSLAIAYRSAVAAKDSSPAALRIKLSIHEGKLSLNILKSRGTTRTELLIDPTDFDKPQGVEWPGQNN